MSQIENFVYSRLKDNLKAHKVLELENGSYVDFPENLRQDIQNVLTSLGIKKLYEHQKLAFDSISKNKDTLVISKTASGKTLSFLLPILNEYFNSEKKFTTLLMYPTKALSRDQEGTLGKLITALKSSSKFGTFDGDSSTEEKERLKNFGEFIITNPDMLHAGILPNHNRKWKRFISSLKYIIIDEVHTYRGSFGSHVANVFSRLIRICRLHGSNPIFICSSATVGNPGQHVEALFKREFQIIDTDTSPRPKRDLYFLSPEMYTKEDGTKIRKGITSVSFPLIQFAAKNNIRTICFCRARQEVEKLYSSIIEADPSLTHKVRPYRSGLLPNERRQIETDLFSGKVNVIISTNALELGIDIGDLELCILSGFPGSFASFWQQAGRVGRKGKTASIAFIAKETPIDQYLINHPEFVIKTPVEEAWLSSFNPYILLQHLPCAAYENPLSENEDLYSHPVYHSALKVLEKENRIQKFKNVYRYSAHDYPSFGVSLRGLNNFNINIVENGKVIGEIDPGAAKTQLHQDAIYQHFGKKYISLELNLETKIAFVQKIDVDYYTEAVSETMVSMKEVEDEKIIFGTVLKYGEININNQPKEYKKIKERTKENLGMGVIQLPAFIYDTTGISISASNEWVSQISQINPRFNDAALYGLSYILKRVSPSFCMADMSDISTDVALNQTIDSSFTSSLYLYDTMEGGVGYSEKIFEKFSDAVSLCLTIIDECECEAGCPACVTPEPEGTDEEMKELFLVSNISVECTKSILVHFQTGNFYPPEIKKFKHSQMKTKEPEINLENEKLEKKMYRASAMLKTKRERLY